ncbi:MULTISPECIES: DNA cytosine methyltransferase [unclassified Devosia]|uniref:DNA cytosine methyltransferase n=1 Tax=unclassified Devosia TaxID=196773 RepID=UPI000A7F582F|nr:MULTISPECIES: DNA cytosine methyltransferase [unclassified Devosia]MBN9304087.1 DNA cytosine methyltransferase [Devosia sp.]
MNAILPDSFREFAAARGEAVPDELIVDGFAGGGGASEGIEQALGDLIAQGMDVPEHVSIAINHDDAAIAMHRINHPHTLHLPHDIWRVNALRVTNGIRVGLGWFSPDCRHHSKAKGGRPVSKSVRDLPWVVAYWAKQVRPRILFLENVEEMRDWGPLLRIAEGVYKPDPARKGQTFDTWLNKFVRMGYRVELRQLRACDYGVPTIRKRLYIIMRCDGEPIVWPEPTHGDPKSEAVASGRLKPWPVAADIIDFDLPCPSILMTRDEARAYTKATGIRLVRPLATNSEARIARGFKRYALDAAEPFVVHLSHGDSGGRRSFGGDEPLTTVEATGNKHAVVVPHVMTMRNAEKPFNGADEPAHSVTAGGAGLSLVEGAIVPFVTHGQHGGRSREAGEPMHTVEASPKNTDQLAQAFLVPRYGERVGQQPRSRAIDEPMPTTVPTGNGGDLAVAYLAQHNGDPRADGQDGARPGRPMDEPLPTSTTRGTQAQQVVAYLAQNNTDVVGHDLRESVSTIVGKGSTQSLAVAMLSHAYTSNTAGGEGDPGKPIKTVLTGNHANLVTLPLVTAYYGNEQSAGTIDTPLRTASTRDRFGVVEGAAATPPLTEAQLARARQVAAFLRQYGCWDERELVTLVIRGVTYIVVDIGMRMLTARELARAQGFPERYVLAAPYGKGVLSDTEQRHKIGNSVCPGVARALVAANYRPRAARSQPTARAA